METVFPFGLESAARFYFIVYILTLVLHVFFMAYVLAGSAYLAWCSFHSDQSDGGQTSPLPTLLREWIPFVLSAAITAGVAPLLFVQILYRREFYTANLLLGWRWMVVIPVLITAFYLLYVIKSRLIANWSANARAALAAVVAACFLFVAFCWTANHQLMIHPETWPESYATGIVISDRWLLVSRLMVWVFGTFPVMAILAGWQLQYFRRHSDWNTQACDNEVQPLTRMTLTGFGLAVVFAVIYGFQLENDVRDAITGPLGTAWVVTIVAGIALQSVAWWMLFRRKFLCRRWLLMATFGCLLYLTGTAAVREIIRVQQVSLSFVVDSADKAANVGGFTAFVVSTVVNIILIAFCIRLVRPASSTAL